MIGVRNWMLFPPGAATADASALTVTLLLLLAVVADGDADAAARGGDDADAGHGRFLLDLRAARTRSIDAVDELLSRRGLRTPFIRLAKDGAVVPAARPTAARNVRLAIRWRPKRCAMPVSPEQVVSPFDARRPG